MFLVFNTLLFLLVVPISQGEVSPCRTSCSSDSTCWQTALAYRSSELIEQLFSFGSLAVRLRTVQEEHSDQMSDSVAFLNDILSDHLNEQSSLRNLSIGIFNQTKLLLIESCRNLTSEPVETVEEFPSLICGPSTCAMDKINWIVLLVIAVLLLVSTGLAFSLQSFRTYRQAEFSWKNFLPEKKPFVTRF